MQNACFQSSSKTSIECKNLFHIFQDADQMQTAVMPEIKYSHDIKPGEEVYGSETGHHLKSETKNVNFFFYLLLI